MKRRTGLRLQFIRVLGIALATAVLTSVAALAERPSGPIRVVVWDERQPAQKQAYENFLGNHLAEFLRGFNKSGKPDFDVKTVGLGHPDQRRPKEVMVNASVLISVDRHRNHE